MSKITIHKDNKSKMYVVGKESDEGYHSVIFMSILEMKLLYKNLEKFI